MIKSNGADQNAEYTLICVKKKKSIYVSIIYLSFIYVFVHRLF